MENNNQQNIDTKEKVLNAIRAEEVTMRPKLFFMTKILAMALVAMAILSITIFMINFVIFSVRVQGHNLLFTFGPQGWLMFVELFPWGLLVLDFVLIFILQKLVRQFRFGYKSPVLFLLLGILIITFPLGFYLDRDTNINDDLFEHVDDDSLLSPINYLYRQVREANSDDQIIRGQILAITGNKLTLLDRDHLVTAPFDIFVPLDSPYATTSNLKVGDVVFIVTDQDEDMAPQAFGLHLLSPFEVTREHLYLRN